MPGRHKFTVLSEKRTIVDRKEHTHGGFINSNTGQLFRVIDIGNGIANFKSLQTHNSTDIAYRQLLYLQPAQSFKGVQLLYFRFYYSTVPFYQGNLLSFL